MAFPDGSIPAQAFGDALLHPTQLYASLAGFGGFAALILLSRRSARDGAVLCALLVLLGLTRFTIDFFRHYPDPEVVLLPGGVAVPIHQLLALAFVLAGESAGPRCLPAATAYLGEPQGPESASHGVRARADARPRTS